MRSQPNLREQPADPVGVAPDPLISRARRLRNKFVDRPLMGDIENRTLLYAKGGLMLAVGFLASALLIARHPDVYTVSLLAVAAWGFCRAYYFAFYVVEHYVDPGYKFAGLCSFLRYLAQRRHRE
jgi:hypothetical protein